MVTTTPAPTKVSAAAAARGLGTHQLTRKGENPIGMFVGWTIFGGVLFGVAALCAWIAGRTEIRALLAVLGGLFAR